MIEEILKEYGCQYGDEDTIFIQDLLERRNLASTFENQQYSYGTLLTCEVLLDKYLARFEGGFYLSHYELYVRLLDLTQYAKLTLD